jgi:regulator of protease activity HflC (stomatin/prohibitin superfamily)
MKRKVFAIFGVVIAIAVIILSGSLFEDADKSKNYVCQMPITGEYRVWTDGGLQFQGFGNLYSYAKTSQIEFSDLQKNEGGYVASGDNPAAGTTFNDRGKGYIIGSFRVVLPTDAQNMMAIQRDFGSEQALINNLVRPTLYKVVTACGPLMSSLESVSETRTDLTAYITDMLNNGVYKTKTSKVEVVNEITGEKELRTQAELIHDASAPGGYARQEKSPFALYGITAGIVSITDIKYDKATQSQIDAQKAANLSVITAKTQALEAMQKAITIEEQGKATAAQAKWEQEKEKAVAVTRAEQEYEVARLEAEKAKQIALKVKAEGEAKAAANKALVAAGLTPLEKATIEKETAIGIAQALADSKVRWVPEIIVSGEGGSGNNAMDAVGLNMMMDVVKKMNTNK